MEHTGKMERTGKRCKCTRPGCGYEWVYGGNLHYITCPDCRKQQPVSKATEEYNKHHQQEAVAPPGT